MREDAQGIRKWARLLRYDVCRMISNANSGHPGGSLSPADIVSTLYFRELNIDPSRPDWPGRDRFILSKGHACPVLYAALARRGYFSVETLATLRTSGSILQGHPEIHTPGVDMTSGCLGQGLSAGAGMALAARMDGAPFRVYVMLGCGEMNEGQNYEAIMLAYQYRLDNLTAILDYNKLQFDGSVEQVLDPGDMVARWRGFNWNVLEIDGHDVDMIIAALAEARKCRGIPTVIIANTIKGKGVPFMEGDYLWHSNMDNRRLSDFSAQMKRELENEDVFYADRVW